MLRAVLTGTTATPGHQELEAQAPLLWAVSKLGTNFPLTMFFKKGIFLLVIKVMQPWLVYLSGLSASL